MTTTSKEQVKQMQSFAEFYPYYLGEHANTVCRRLHFVGTSLALLCFLKGLISGAAVWLLFGLIVGYGFAWVGHFVFEKNRPASFSRPLYSFMGDWVMWFSILTGKIKF